MNILILGALSATVVANNIAMFRDKGINLEILNINKSATINLPEELKTNVTYTNFYKPSKGLTSKIKTPTVKSKSPIDKNRLTIFFWDKIKFEQIRIRLRKFYENFAYYRNVRKFNLHDVDRVIKKGKIDLVFSFWGAQIVSEVNIMKKKYDIPIVHSIQSYPYGKSIVGDKTKGDPLHESFFRKLDGRIHASPNMLKYFKTKFDMKGKGKDIILMEYFKESYFSRKRRNKLSERDKEPHLVFIGRTDFEFRDLDDIRSQIYELANHKIHFHAVRSTMRFQKSKYIHFFDGYSSNMLYTGKFADDLTQYDACIVIYNLSKRFDRFWNSLPARFLSAVTIGIPIVLPKGFFGGCEYYLKKFNLGFTYEDYEDLKSKLYDKEFMRQQEKNVMNSHRELTFERNFHKLKEFFEEVVNDYKS